MPFPLLAAAIPSLIGGLFGMRSAKNAPTQQTQTQGGSSQTLSGSMLDPLARANVTYGLDQARQQYGAGSVSPVFGQAQGAIGQGLSGQMNFGGYQARQVNPYADMAFGNAANATQSRLSSEFARSGRNVSASAAPRSVELQNLAAGIYGPAYESEAQRQYGAQESAANRGAGAYGQSLNASPYFSQTEQGLGLDQYLQRMQGLVGQLPTEQYGNTNQQGNVTTPLYNSPMAGFVGGAMLGRSLFPNTGQGGSGQGGATPGIYDYRGSQYGGYA